MALDHLGDAAHVGDVGADAEDHARSSAVAPAAIHCRAHLAHRLAEAVENRLADQEMADIELDDLAAAPRSFPR